MSVSDPLGRVLMTRKFGLGHQPEVVDLSPFPGGSYILAVRGSTATATFRLVKL